MDTHEELRNKLIRKIQNLPADKLSEAWEFVDSLDEKPTSKEETLSFVEIFKESDEETFLDLTDRLPENRMHHYSSKE